MTRVRLQSVEKIYGDYTVLRSIDLSVVSGEFLTILGPSGAGKSTILGLIGGLIFPSSGAIFIGDRDVTEVEAEKRNVGIVFQNYALFPHLTVEGNVDYPLRIRNIPKAERVRRITAARIRNIPKAERVRRITAALQMVRLEKFAGRYPRQLSGGQQQRVALARALVFEPSILLLDEPLGALDTKLREEVRLELLQLQRRLAITTVLVTHDQDEALTLSDRIAVVNDGAIVQTDAPETLYQRPASRFVANFLGLANTLPGSIARSADGEALVQTKIGLAVQCAAGAAAQGSSGDAILRPEGLMFASAKEANTVAGVVTETVYLGSYTRAYVKIEQEQVLIVNLIAGEAVPELGSEVFVGQRRTLLGAFVTS